MLNWLLIISITLVSTTMLMFSSAYLAIIPQTQEYYKKQQSDILLLSNSFNILYLIVAPLILSSLKKHFCLLVNISVILTAVGAVGRYLCQNDYNTALVMSSLVAIAHIPIITAPYGLLDLFPEWQKGYAASIPLFVPTLGINFSILYGMHYIASEYAQTIVFTKQNQLEKLNLIIAIIGLVSCISTLFFVFLLKKQIQKVNQSSQKEGTKSNNSLFLSGIRQQFKGGIQIAVMLVCWGVLLGISWTYGGMFGIFLKDTGLTHKDIALVGLFANLSSVFFSNLGNWISNLLKLPNNLIIFILNMTGFFASLFIQASTVINSPAIQNKVTLIIMIILLRAGFSSFVSLALVELSHCGSSVMITSIFFYIANASNLGGNFIVDYFQNFIGLAIICAVIWLCIFLTEISENKFSKYKQYMDAEKQIKNRNAGIELMSEQNTIQGIQKQEFEQIDQNRQQGA